MTVSVAVNPILALGAALAFLAGAPAVSPPVAAEDALADFDALWTIVDENYAYFDGKRTRWNEVRAIHRPAAATVRTKGELIAVLERALGELYDSHLHLNANTAESPPLIPSGTDLWGEWRDGRAVIVQVRPGSPASAAGVRSMDEVIAIDGVPVADAIRPHIGRSLRAVDDEVRSWALRVALAGRRGSSRALRIARKGREKTVAITPRESGGGEALIDSRILEGNIGYVRFANSLGNAGTIAAFDDVLAELRETSSLIVDLRDTPGGGNTTVARGILGRFVTRETPYQRHVLVSEQRATGVRRSWLELVSPRGPFIYAKPVVVLVDHWTGSMGEGLAMGLDAAAGATVVGTAMAGLLGATYTFQLPRSGIGVNIPAERLTHVDGTPRERFRPEVLVTDEELRGATGDAILEGGLRVLRKGVAL